VRRAHRVSEIVSGSKDGVTNTLARAKLL
jgi:hypothetical protein